MHTPLHMGQDGPGRAWVDGFFSLFSVNGTSTFGSSLSSKLHKCGAHVCHLSEITAVELIAQVIDRGCKNNIEDRED